MNPRFQNPYVGPRAFQDGEMLYGRDREVKKLLNLLIAERIVLLYSPSGAGKTSLVQAALIPELREEGFRVLPVIRVGLEPAPDLELPATTNRYILSTILSLEEEIPPEQQTPLTELVNMDLTTYFNQRLAEDIETDGDVLIFDQFEEILTVDPTDQKAKAKFFAQLGKALRPRNRWALFAMREEYPAGLDPYLRPLPTRLSTTFRLELLGAKAARQAMQEPARQTGVPFTDSAAQKLIDDLRRVQVQQPDGTTAERPGLYIEPVQLQVVCYRLWENLPEEATEIRETDIREAGDVDSALAGYYADRVTATAENTNVPERVIREWFNSQLITEQGIRGQVLRGSEQSQGLENQAIEPLVDAHLIRAENRRGATWYELTHDRLIKPVKEDNADWRETHLSALQRQATLWESQNRSTGLLLRDEALEDAERWSTTHQDEILPVEQEFLIACQEARAIAEREQKQTHRIRRLAIGASIVSIVALIAIIIGTFFFFQARQEAERARQAEDKAEIRAEEALKAKNEAEEARVETERRRKEAENARAKAEHMSHISLVQVLAFQALRQQNQGKKDERAALLARQAYLLNQKYQGDMLNQVDEALRAVLSTPHFSYIVPGNESFNFSVALSPDNQTLALSSFDVQLFNLTSSIVKPMVLPESEGANYSMAFSQDGRILASGCFGGAVRLWDVTKPTTTPTVLRGHDDHVHSVSFSPDGRMLASGSKDKTVRLWDLTDPDAIPTVLHGHDERISSVAFSPDGKRLASGSDDKTVRLWDLTDPGAFPTILRGHDERISSVAFSPDGKTLASSSWDNTVRLWDLTDPGVIPTILSGHEEDIYSIAFSADGKILASGSGDNTIRLWDLTDLDAAPTILRGHEQGIIFVAFSSDGQYLLSSTHDGTSRLWELSPSLVASNILHGHERGVTSIAFSPDGKTLASSSDDKTVRLWDLANPDAVSKILHRHEYGISSIAFSSDGKTLASGSYENLRLWDLTSPNVEPTVLYGQKHGVLSIAFSPDGRTLASGGFDQTVRLWDLTNLSIGSTILSSQQRFVESVVFSPDGQILASGGGDGTVCLWDLQNLAVEPRVLSGQQEWVSSVVFSPDGRILASGSEDGTIWLWDLTKPEAVPTVLQGHERSVSSMAFSLDSQILASGSKDNTIRLWDLTNLTTAPIILREHKGEVTSVAFSPDGKTLVSGSLDKTIRIRTWRTERLSEIVCEKVWRNLSMEEWRQFISLDIPYERTCPNLPVHPSVLETGRNLAKEGGTEEAIAIFQRMLELDQNLDLDPQVEADKWVALGKAEQFVKEGNIEGAVTNFQQALALDSGVDGSSQTKVREWGAQRLVKIGRELANQGKVQEAIAAYAEAQTLDPTLKISASSWDTLCRLGSLWEYAADVMDACEQAVMLDPEDDYIRDSRGLARALTGDIDGAIEDFQMFVDGIDDGEQKSQRQQWIGTLQAGKNPFTPEVLEKLRNEM